MTTYVHGFFTTAGYDQEGRPIPAGLGHDISYAGMLLFVGDARGTLDTYDVYWTTSNVAMGPLSQSFEWRGQVEDVYASMPQHRWMEEGEPMTIRLLCGYGQPIHEFWASRNEERGLDLYVQTRGQMPSGAVSHYCLDVTDVTRWWTAQSYTYRGMVTMPIWVASSGQRSPPW